ncbi:NUDIX hydrolase [Cognatishimia sp. F0-27]|uniref:NUDIX domain-containing protein n=1 Tax=Cognatishimia sp. F0-27 TaxID=2816855 RepID=UPI001D0C8157|nr:NUDIX hydrolase [Cognatishimia sp. F0-27]MCC1490997.1 NUDIX hydrolase [Cognatishimia sp. F0-27]
MTSFLKPAPRPRVAVRAVILHDDRLLLVNAWPGDQSDLWCAPGGGVELGASLPENLAREVWEETGLRVTVGPPCLVNEFHDPDRAFHQIEIFFRCAVAQGTLDPDWSDPEKVVTKRGFFSQEALAGMRVKPTTLPQVAWGEGIGYDPLERLVR